MAERLFAIADLELPEDIYTRARGTPWWLNVHIYADEMKNGAKFPPILVGELDGRLIVVDGYHRVNAYKKLKIEFIQGIYKKYNSIADILRDAVEANNHHGVRYGSQDKAHITKLLQEYGLQRQEVADLMRVSVEKLDKFTVRNLDNKTLKAPLARLVREGKITEEEAAEVDQSRFSTMMLDDVLVQLISYLEFGAYPWGDAKYDAYAKRIVGLIMPHIQG
jgi:polyhydroxyalkanoate synthesis regulator phasin